MNLELLSLAFVFSTFRAFVMALSTESFAGDSPSRSEIHRFA